MNPLHLASLLAIVDEGSFEAAADSLGVTPSAVSQRIKALEKDVGRVLVRRTSPATATEAVASGVGYPCLRISPTDSRDIVAVVPMDEPDTAANPAHAITVATPRPPGRRRNRWAATEYTCSAIPAFIANIPMRMNMGMIVSVNFDVSSKGKPPSMFVA